MSFFSYHFVLSLSLILFDALSLSRAVAGKRELIGAQNTSAQVISLQDAAGGERFTVRGRQGAGVAASYGTHSVSLGPLGGRDLLDTPFSVMTVPHDAILNQQARNVNDLAQYLPSVQLEMRGDPNTSRPQSRGFEADVLSNSRLDGLNIVITTPYPAEMFQSLQVLNGLSGALYGPQNPAGTFDYTLSRPTDRRSERLIFGLDSNGAPLESVDVSGRLGAGRRIGYRVIMLNQSGNTYAPGSHLRRALVSGAFDFSLTRHTMLQVDASQYSFAERGYAGGFSYATGIALPRAPDLSRQGYGQPYAGYNTSTNMALVKLIHRLGENWSLTLGGLYQDAYRDVFPVTNTMLSLAGRYRASISATTTAKDFMVYSNLAYLNGQFHTGLLVHEIVLGSNGYSMGTYNPTRGQTTLLGEAQIGAPVIFSGSQLYFSGTYQSASIKSQSLLASDTIYLTSQWSIIGSLNWSWIDSTSRATSGARTAHYFDGPVFVPAISLIFRPTYRMSLYATWGRSLQPGPTAPSSSVNVNAVLAPLRSVEYGLGAKYQVPSGLLVRVAGFRMTRGFAFTDPTTSVFTEKGIQRNYGFEAQATGSLTRALSVIGGVTWLDARSGATGSTLTSYKGVMGVPAVQASLLLDFHPRFLAGGVSMPACVIRARALPT